MTVILQLFGIRIQANLQGGGGGKARLNVATPTSRVNLWEILPKI